MWLPARLAAEQWWRQGLTPGPGMLGLWVWVELPMRGTQVSLRSFSCCAGQAEGGFLAAGLGLPIYHSGPILVCPGGRVVLGMGGGRGTAGHLHAPFPTVLKEDVPKLSKNKSEFLFK